MGSARYYVEEIQKVGIEEQQAERRYFSVKKKMEFYCEALHGMNARDRAENHKFNVTR